MAAGMMETKKGGRDDNDHSGHVVQSGNPVPRLAGNQPARKLPIQMYKVKASPLFGLNTASSKWLQCFQQSRHRQWLC